MITVLLFYLFLMAIWLENVAGIKISTIHGISLLNISLYALILAWLINIIVKQKIFNPGKINYLILILSIWVICTIPFKLFFNELPNFSLAQEIIYFKNWLSPFLIFLILYNTLEHKKHCLMILNGLIIFLIITASTTIAFASGAIHFGKLKLFTAEKRTAGFIEPNQYAALLVLFIPLLLSRIISSSLKHKIIATISAILVMTALIITGSRGGVISLFIALLAYFFMLFKHKIIKSLKIVLIVFCLVPMFFMISFYLAPPHIQQMIVQRFNPTGKDSVELTSGRTILWPNAFKLFLESPIVGHGLYTALPLMKKNFPIWANTHNDYLKYMVEFGIIGTILFIMVLYTLFRKGLEAATTAQDQITMITCLSYVAGLAGFAVAMFGVNMMQPLFLFWAYSAAVLRLGQISIEAKTQ